MGHLKQWEEGSPPLAPLPSSETVAPPEARGLADPTLLADATTHELWLCPVPQLTSADHIGLDAFSEPPPSFTMVCHSSAQLLGLSSDETKCAHTPACARPRPSRQPLIARVCFLPTA